MLKNELVNHRYFGIDWRKIWYANLHNFNLKSSALLVRILVQRTHKTLR